MLQRVPLELADGDARALERQRRDDRVHAAAVLQARVDQRADDSSMRRPIGATMRSMTPSTAWLEEKIFSERVILPLLLDVDLVGVVHHDLADVFVGEERLERPQAQRLVEHVGEQLVAVDVLGELPVRLHLVEDVADRLLGAAPELFVAEPVHVQAAQVEVLDQPVVDVLLEPRVGSTARVDLALAAGAARRPSRPACSPCGLARAGARRRSSARASSSARSAPLRRLLLLVVLLPRPRRRPPRRRSSRRRPRSPRASSRRPRPAASTLMM